MILAIANANMVQKYPLTYGGKRSIMNIMVEVENKIKSHSPLDTIKGVLDNFKSAVTEEQGTHDAVYVAQQAECQSEIGYRKAEVDDTIGTLKIANGILMFASVSTKMNKAFMIPLAALASIKQEENAAGAAERLKQMLKKLGLPIQLKKKCTSSIHLIKDLFLATQERLESSKQQLVIKSENIHGVITVQTAVAQAAAGKKQRNQILWDDAEDLCLSFDVEYEAVSIRVRKSRREKSCRIIMRYKSIQISYQFFIQYQFGFKAFKKGHKQSAADCIILLLRSFQYEQISKKKRDEIFNIFPK
ncbi:unnamed protein product (macronuclear) [Paramecium tetraurelia]|uniref:Uncharacterized protein n=1 Tax=Paramecium tetraurelia TaxID=5888 RepID=A0BQ62_PARTE|nr:uncharacterized protein GSPATT00005430001 [Paramecium tetraurelia]CAK60679.1 unnamed protein product [Paramecium tetraurelia]|eukprot:XP_001428077.1 hypothetical protein (macronuclear) [Paramecium tetraurelia strain d4-2]